MRILIFPSILKSAFSATSALIPSIASTSGVVFSLEGNPQEGKVTTYGPNPIYPPGNEPGYRAGQVGVGCSLGSHDVRWNNLLASGTYKNELDNGTVWPVQPTVAVSEAAWGKSLCFMNITITSSKATIVATVVDLCPAAGCLWEKSTRAFNADIYGVKTFQALGGDPMGGNVVVKISWPKGMQPNLNSSIQLIPHSTLIALFLAIFFVL